MGADLRHKPGPTPKATPVRSTPAPDTTRPGLPLSLLAETGSGTEAGADAVNLRAVGRNAERQRALREAPPEETPEEQATTGDGAQETGEAGTQEGGQTPKTGTGQEGDGAADGQAAPPPETVDGETARRDTPVRMSRRARPSAADSQPKPVIPRVEIPDRAFIRAPLVPPPPPAVVEKRLTVLKTTGSLPEVHHAEVQRAVNTMADAARTAQRTVIAEVGSIAARTRGEIAVLANRIPGVVAGGVARIRAGADAVKSQVDIVAARQIAAIVQRATSTEASERQAGDQTAQTMHTQLMKRGPQVLRVLKAEMDAGLQAQKIAAQTQIRGIKSGTEPPGLETADPIGDRQRAEAQAEADAKSPPQPIDAPTPPTWDAAEERIAGALSQDLPDARLAQFGNFRCAGALPGLVDAEQRNFDTSIDTAVENVGNPEMVQRFFEATMGLTLPLTREEERNADPVADTAYLGAFRGQLGEAFMNLRGDARAAARQIDQKRQVLRDETLNPDHDGSLPHAGIKGLREAGAKIMQGLEDQSRVIEASLKANLARLAVEYPDIVERLRPMVETGEFLEATATLAQIAEARAGIPELERGHIEMVAEQAQVALKQARQSFDQQAASLRKTAAKSVEGMQEYGARAHYDIARTAVAYTGIIDEGLAAAMPQIYAHAERTANRLLGPPQRAQMGYSNVVTAAINHLNGAISGEWRRYLLALEGLEEKLGGVATGSAAAGGERTTEFGRIRQAVKQDARQRATDVEAQMDPAPLDSGDRVLVYGGAILAAPFTGGASVAGAVGYDIYSDPDEADIATFLAIPWPGPMAVEEAQTTLRNRTSLRTLIRDRLESEGQRDDILALFSSDVGTRSRGRTNLIAGADDWGGVGGAAALALSSSYSPEELSSEFMSATDRQRMSDSLNGALSDSTDREIAAAYINGEPDQALALRMRQLFDRQRGKEYNEQLQTGARLDQLIQSELWGGSRYAYVPESQLADARNAAYLRFPEVSADRRQRVTITAEAPFRPIERTPEPDTPAATPTPGEAEGTATTPPGTPQSAAAPPSDTQPQPQPRTEAPAPPQPTVERNHPTNADREARRQPSLAEAQEAVVTYMNRPTLSYYAGSHHRHAEGDMARSRQIGLRHEESSYDPETGRVTRSPAAAIQEMNRAIIMHGPTTPQARGATAAASIAWMPTYGTPSENQLNQLNENFSDTEFNAFRVRYENASPREQERMADQRTEAQAKHRQFLRSAAEHMDMPPEQLDDPAEVERFLTNRLGEQFGRVDSQFRDAGQQIITQGRIAIDTGMDLAAYGAGTNEQMVQNVLLGRSEAELSQRRRSDGLTMRQYATSVAESELSGDDWLQAREKLRGPDENDFERADTAEFLIDQQLEEGTSWLSEMTMEGTWQEGDMHARRQDVRNRMTGAMQAGIEEARRRGIELPAEIPDSAYLPDGTLHPLARRFAMDGDGNLRGSGPSMGVLVADTRQASDAYRAEIDRQEGFFTTVITTLAILASVVALIIPGVNVLAAGILVALLAGAATVAVKSGMRGSRYGWEEAAVDVGTAAVEAATAGAGAALSKGARLAQVARAAHVAGDAAEAARAAQAVGKLGALGRTGAAMSTKLGPLGAAVVQEGVSGAISGAANAAMNDQIWRDGISRGLLRMAGHSLQGAAAGAVNAGVSGKITSGLDGALAPVAGSPKTAGALSRIGGKLSGAQRELVTETISGLAGSLSSEGVNILADLARDPDKMTMKMALERLGKSGLKNLIGSTSKTALQQSLRGHARRIGKQIMAEGRDPTPGEARLLRQLSLAGGLIHDDVSAADYAASFSRARARIAQMPPELHPFLHGMSPDKALKVVAKLDSGDLGNRAQRANFVNALGHEGIDLRAFDRTLVQANVDHAPERRARKQRLRATARTVSGDVRGPEREALNRVDFADLSDLPPATQRRLGRALAAGETDFAQILDGIDNPGQRQRARAAMDVAATTLGEARTEARVARARIRDELGEAVPEALRGTLAGLKDRDAAALHKHLQDDSPAGQAQAQAILRGAGMSPEEATQAVRQLAPRLEEQAQRALFTDNVPPEHRDTMAGLAADALMEIRVAQFTRKPLTPERIDALVADARATRPGTDAKVLRTAIEATLAHRHGRPGFREALAQKRAFLSLVPWGMKSDVLRTPVLTLPDSAFMAYVRGKGDENAVTLIVNGEPVVLVRQGARLGALAEEGQHVLQWHDPKLRTRMSDLDERRLTRWSSLSLDDQIDTYGRKVDIEIDAQQRMITRLSAKAERALWPGARRRIREELVAAQESLTNLHERRADVDAMAPERRRAIEADEENRPGWLKQPARMFNKDEQLFDREMPKARKGIRDAYFDLVAEFPDLPRDDRKRLLGLLRTMKGAATLKEIKGTLGHFTIQRQAAKKAGQAGMPPGDLVNAIRDHLMAKARLVTIPETDDNGKVVSSQTRDLVKRADAVDAMLAKRLGGEEDIARMRETARSLLLHNPSDTPELVTAKRAMFLALEKYHAKGLITALAERLRLTARIVGLDDNDEGLAALHARPELQALVLEGLATNKALSLAGKGPSQASENAYIRAVVNLTATDGVLNFPAHVQQRVFQTLARSFFAGGDAETLMMIGTLPRKLNHRSLDADLDTASSILTWSQELIARVPPRRQKEFIQKLDAMITYDMDVLGFHPAHAAQRQQVTVWELKNYVMRAIVELTGREGVPSADKLASSLARIAGRTQKAIDELPEDGGDDVGPQISPRDRQALADLKPISTGQEEFLDRHGGDLPGTGVGQDVSATRQATADWVEAEAQKHAATFGLTAPEARAIAKRIEVLDQSGLLGPLLGDHQTRAQLMETFLKTLDTATLGDISTTALAGKTPDQRRTAMNKRGEAIEAAFRRHVRNLAVGTDTAPGLVQQLAGTTTVTLGKTKLDAEAKLELIFILARGVDEVALDALPGNGGKQIRKLRNDLVELYMQRLTGDPEYVAIADGDIEVALGKMFGGGFANVEKLGKGKMFEHLVETMLALKPAPGDAVPKRFGEVSSVTSDKTVAHAFRSGDQKPGDAKRSLDHVVRVEKPAAAQPDAAKPAKTVKPGADDFAEGDLIGTDSKNGKGAFDEPQFRRYLVEMLNGAAGRESIFGPGPKQLKALMYLADSPANAKHAHAKVTKIITELLEQAGDRTTGTIKMKIEDYEQDIDIADLRKFGRTLRVHFAHIGQVQAPGSSGGRTLGPFRMENYGPSPAELFDAQYPEKAPKTDTAASESEDEA